LPRSVAARLAGGGAFGIATAGKPDCYRIVETARTGAAQKTAKPEPAAIPAQIPYLRHDPQQLWDFSQRHRTHQIIRIFLPCVAV
jgi:hypothetical protein